MSEEDNEWLCLLLAEIIRRDGGADAKMRSAQACSTLYQEYPGSKELLQSAGGLRALCKVLKSKVIRFEPDSGCGWIHLDQRAAAMSVEAGSPAEEEEDGWQEVGAKVSLSSSNKAPSSSQREITGKIIHITPSAAFIESSPGNSDVYVGRLLLGGFILKKDDIITVFAERHVHGKNNWRAIQVLKAPRSGASIASKGGAAASCTPGDVSPAAAGPVVVRERFLGQHEDAPICAELREITGKVVQIKGLLSFMKPENCVGGNVCIHKSTWAGFVLQMDDTVTVLAEKHVHGMCNWRAIQVVRATNGGVSMAAEGDNMHEDAFPAPSAPNLAITVGERFLGDDDAASSSADQPEMTGSSSAQQPEIMGSSAAELKDITGKVVTVLGAVSFMEPLWGRWESNVYIHKNTWSGFLVHKGDVITVLAEPHEQGQCKWRAVKVLHAPTTAPEGGLGKTPPPAELKEITGRVVRVLGEGVCFMEPLEPSFGSGSNVYIHRNTWGSFVVHKGDVVTVLAKWREQGQCKWCAIKVLHAPTAAPAAPDAPAEQPQQYRPPGIEARPRTPPADPTPPSGMRIIVGEVVRVTATSCYLESVCDTYTNTPMQHVHLATREWNGTAVVQGDVLRVLVCEAGGGEEGCEWEAVDVLGRERDSSTWTALTQRCAPPPNPTPDPPPSSHPPPTAPPPPSSQPLPMAAQPPPPPSSLAKHAKAQKQAPPPAPKPKVPAQPVAEAGAAGGAGSGAAAGAGTGVVATAGAGAEGASLLQNCTVTRVDTGHAFLITNKGKSVFMARKTWGGVKMSEGQVVSVLAELNSDGKHKGWRAVQLLTPAQMLTRAQVAAHKVEKVTAARLNHNAQRAAAAIAAGQQRAQPVRAAAGGGGEAGAGAASTNMFAMLGEEEGEGGDSSSDDGGRDGTPAPASKSPPCPKKGPFPAQEQDGELAPAVEESEVRGTIVRTERFFAILESADGAASVTIGPKVRGFDALHAGQGAAVRALRDAIDPRGWRAVEILKLYGGVGGGGDALVLAEPRPARAGGGGGGGVTPFMGNASAFLHGMVVDSDSLVVPLQQRPLQVRTCDAWEALGVEGCAPGQRMCVLATFDGEGWRAIRVIGVDAYAVACAVLRRASSAGQEQVSVESAWIPTHGSAQDALAGLLSLIVTARDAELLFLLTGLPDTSAVPEEELPAFWAAWVLGGWVGFLLDGGGLEAVIASDCAEERAPSDSLVAVAVGSVRALTAPLLLLHATRGPDVVDWSFAARLVKAAADVPPAHPRDMAARRVRVAVYVIEELGWLEAATGILSRPVRGVDGGGVNCLAAASRACRPDVVRALLACEGGAGLLRKRNASGKGLYPLHIACLAHDADPWRTPEEREDDLASVLALLVGADPGAVDLECRGKLPFTIACEAGLPERLCEIVLPSGAAAARALAPMLARDGSVAEGDAHAVAVLAGAVSGKCVAGLHLRGFLGLPGSAGVLESLLARADPPLERAAVHELVRAAVGVRDWAAARALLGMGMAEGFDAELLCVHDVVAAEQSELLRALLECGASPNAVRGGDEATPLHVAAGAGSTACMRELLEPAFGAQCNLQEGRRGQTPLHRACMARAHVAKDMIRLLLDGNADPSVQDNKKLTPSKLLQITGAGQPKSIRDALVKMLDGSASRKKANKQPATAEPKYVASGASASAVQGDCGSVQQSVVSGPAQLATEPAAKSGVPQHAQQDSVGALGGQGGDKADKLFAVYEKILSFASVHVPDEQGGGMKPPQAEEVRVAATDSPQSRAAPAQAEGGGGEGALVARDVGREVQRVECVREEEAMEDVGREDADECPVDRLAVSLAGKEWDLRMTKTFKEQLFDLAGNPVLQQSTIRRLQQLASGEQGKSLIKRLRGASIGIRNLGIYESPCRTFHDGERIIWQYAEDYSPRIKAFTETIRLWMICKHDEVAAGINYIVQAHRRGRTSSVRKLLQPVSSGPCVDGGRRFPRTFVEKEGQERVRDILEQEDIQFGSLEPEGVDDDATEDAKAGTVVFTPPAVSSAESLNVLKFYALSDEVVSCVLSSSAQNCSAAAKGEHQGAKVPVEQPEFPFIPDKKEFEIISQPSTSSILLVGRSGTGKTTTAVSRMWERYKAWHEKFSGADAPLDDGGGGAPHYHQIFVTANKVLRDKVRKNFQGMKYGMQQGMSPSSGGQFDGLMPSEYPPTFKAVPSEMFPLFLTQGEFLRMLDGLLDTPFFPRNADGTLKYSVRGGFHEEVGTLDALPDEDEWFLDDDEGEMQQGPDTAEDGGRGRDTEVQPWERKEIEFRTFAEIVWPKIRGSCRNDTKHMSPSALFTEIHSYIKGSLQALDTPLGYLSREEYLRLPIKMAPTFQGLAEGDNLSDVRGDRRGTRDLIYDLFEEYEAYKKSVSAYDISDVCHHIWKELKRVPYSGTLLHSLFIDEAQDFTQAELAIFLEVSADKNDCFFSGDTCQTISSGVGFRFEDLKNVFSYLESSRPAGKYVPIVVPQLRSMQINYRTHNGILSCAASVVDLINEYFPRTLDKLPREKGHFSGPKPIFLREISPESATIMIVGSDKKASQIEFGAHQVVLVRNQEAKRRLPESFDGCLVMTVLEAKGLEFDDVFLWEFFADSRADQEWRLVLSYLISEGEGEDEMLAAARAEERDSTVAGMLRPLEFCDFKHQLFCEELKHLYTAITRSRDRVIFFDSHAARRAPMFHYLTRRDLVLALDYSGDNENFSPMATSTSAEQWRAQGFNLKENGIFELAAKCFHHSGDRKEELECHAEHLCRRAQDEPESASSRKDLFLDASKYFLDAGRGDDAAKCLFSSGEYGMAGLLYKEMMLLQTDGIQQQQYGKRAVRCFNKASGLQKEALEVMIQCGMIRSAIGKLAADKKYGQALDLLIRNPDSLVAADINSVIKPAAEQNLHAQTDKGRGRFFAAVGMMSLKDRVNYLTLRGEKQELVKLLVEIGKSSEAAKVLADDNKLLEAVNMLEALKTVTAAEAELAADMRLAYALSPACTQSREHLSGALRGYMKAGSMEGGRQASSIQISMACASRAEPREVIDQMNAVLEAAEKDGSVLGVALAMDEYLLARLQALEAGPIEDATALLTMLSARKVVSKLELALSAVTGEGAVMCEQFYGISRENGILCVSKYRKVLLDATLPLGEEAFVPKGDKFVVSKAKFTECLETDLAQRTIQALTVMHDAIEWFACRSGQIPLRVAALRVWVLNYGANKLALPPFKAVQTRPTKPSLFATGRKPSPAAELFGVMALKGLCKAAMRIVCPSISARGSALQLKDCFRSDEGWEEWQDAAESARHAMREHALSWADGIVRHNFDNNTPHVLSLVVCALDALGFASDVPQILAKMSRHQAYAPLKSAREASRAGDLFSEACCLVQYLRGHAMKKPPVDALVMLEGAVVEIVVALSYEATAAMLGLSAAAALSRKSTPLRAYMPRSLATTRFDATVRSRATDDSKLWQLLQTALVVAKKLLQAAAKEGSALDSARSRVSVLASCVLINFLAHTCGDEGHAGTHWQKEWRDALEICVSDTIGPLQGLFAIKEGGQQCAQLPSQLNTQLMQHEDELILVQGTYKDGRVLLGLAPSFDMRGMLQADELVLQSAQQHRATTHAGAKEGVQEATYTLNPEAMDFVPSFASAAAPGEADGQEEETQSTETIKHFLCCRRVKIVAYLLRRRKEAVSAEAPVAVPLDTAQLQAQDQAQDDEARPQQQQPQLPGPTWNADVFQRGMYFDRFQVRTADGQIFDIINTDLLGSCLDPRIVSSNDPRWQQTLNQLDMLKKFYSHEVLQQLISADHANIELQSIVSTPHLREIGASRDPQSGIRMDATLQYLGGAIASVEETLMLAIAQYFVAPVLRLKDLVKDLRQAAEAAHEIATFVRTRMQEQQMLPAQAAHVQGNPYGHEARVPLPMQAYNIAPIVPHPPQAPPQQHGAASRLAHTNSSNWGQQQPAQGAPGQHAQSPGQDIADDGLQDDEHLGWKDKTQRGRGKGGGGGRFQGKRKHGNWHGPRRPRREGQAAQPS